MDVVHFEQDIKSLGAASDGLMRLRTVTYRYKQPDGSMHGSVWAHRGRGGGNLPGGGARNKEGRIETVQYYKLGAMLLSEVQKQQRLIEELIARVASLRSMGPGGSEHRAPWRLPPGDADTSALDWLHLDTFTRRITGVGNNPF